jgi:hypothetical protein
MFKFFRHVIRGAGYLEGYGYHPGTGMLFIIGLLGGLAGVQNGGLAGLLGGFVIAFVFTLPFYIIGCVDRSKGYDRDQQRLLKLIKES